MRVVGELVGKEVLSSDVRLMGKVIDVDFDDLDATVESIIVSSGGIQETLNIRKSELVVPFDMIEKIGDKIILKDLFDDEFSQIEDEIEDLKSQL